MGAGAASREPYREGWRWGSRGWSPVGRKPFFKFGGGRVDDGNWRRMSGLAYFGRPPGRGPPGRAGCRVGGGRASRAGRVSRGQPGGLRRARAGRRRRPRRVGAAVVLLAGGRRQRTARAAAPARGDRAGLPVVSCWRIARQRPSASGSSPPGRPTACSTCPSPKSWLARLRAHARGGAGRAGAGRGPATARDPAAAAGGAGPRPGQRRGQPRPARRVPRRRVAARAPQRQPPVARDCRGDPPAEEGPARRPRWPRLAVALKGALRRGGDLLASYGDGRFAAVLPEVGAGGATTVARALRQAASGAAPGARVRLGVATLRPQETPTAGPQTLMSQAHAALSQDPPA